MFGAIIKIIWKEKLFYPVADHIIKAIILIA